MLDGQRHRAPIAVEGKTKGEWPRIGFLGGNVRARCVHRPLYPVGTPNRQTWGGRQDRGDHDEYDEARQGQIRGLHGALSSTTATVFVSAREHRPPLECGPDIEVHRVVVPGIPREPIVVVGPSIEPRIDGVLETEPRVEPWEEVGLKEIAL